MDADLIDDVPPQRCSIAHQLALTSHEPEFTVGHPVHRQVFACDSGDDSIAKSLVLRLHRLADSTAKAEAAVPFWTPGKTGKIQGQDKPERFLGGFCSQVGSCVPMFSHLLLFSSFP